MSWPQTWRPLFAPPPAHGGTATLEFIAQNKALYIAKQVLWILPNALAVLVFVALFVALKPLGQSLALIAENNTPAIVGVLPAAGILLISDAMTRGVLPRSPVVGMVHRRRRCPDSPGPAHPTVLITRLMWA